MKKISLLLLAITILPLLCYRCSTNDPITQQDTSTQKDTTWYPKYYRLVITNNSGYSTPSEYVHFSIKKNGTWVEQEITEEGIYNKGIYVERGDSLHVQTSAYVPYVENSVEIQIFNYWNGLNPNNYTTKYTADRTMIDEKTRIEYFEVYETLIK